MTNNAQNTEYEEELEARLALAELLMSICYHLCMVDGKIDDDDDDLANILLDSFFGDEDSLFPDGYVEDEDEIANVIADAFENPLELNEIIELCQEDKDLAEIVYDTVDLLLQEKEATSPEETKFLESLAKSFKK